MVLFALCAILPLSLQGNLNSIPKVLAFVNLWLLHRTIILDLLCLGSWQALEWASFGLQAILSPYNGYLLCKLHISNHRITY